MAHEEHTGQSTAPQQPTTLNETYYLNRGARQPPNRRSLGIALIVVGLIWLATAWTPNTGFLRFGSHGSNTLIDRTISATQIQLDAGSADVKLIRGSGTDIRVEAMRDGGGDNDFTINLIEDGNTLRVNHTSAPCIVFCNRSLSYLITLPSEAQAIIQTNSGDIVADTMPNPMTLLTTSGDIELSGMTGTLKANTTSGDIRLERSNLAGAVIETTSGGVNLDGITKNIQVKTVSGDITISDARDGLLDLTTISGDIDYAGSLEPANPSQISTVSGSVQLQLPEASNIALDASSVSGTTQTEFTLAGTNQEHTLQGKIGNGTTPLTIRTTSGDVEINRQ